MMAQVTMTICDLHQQQGEEVPGTARSIVIDAFKAKPDLCEECYSTHVVPLVTLLESIGSAAPVTRSRSRSRRRGRAAKGAPSSAAVRAWAAEQGIEVSTRGKLRKDLVDEYQAAHA